MDPANKEIEGGGGNGGAPNDGLPVGEDSMAAEAPDEATELTSLGDTMGAAAGDSGTDGMERGTLSPLTGSYLLIVLAEPHSEEDREVIIQRLIKGLKSWNMDTSHVDLTCELLNLANAAPEGDEARNGEKLVQWASENLVVEVLIHCQVNTLLQCMKNLLSSFTRHRHIIYGGYTFQGSGSWILQDGTFSITDFLELWAEPEVTRILGAYKGDISVSIHCATENAWTEERLHKESFSKLCQVSMNPPDKILGHSSGIISFVDYISKLLVAAPLKEVLEPSEIVGNIRFSHPTLYVFPGGQGDAALFGINGFNMLIDGGFSRRSCFWEFTRHLDRLDAVLLTRVNNNAMCGLDAVLDRKRLNQVHPNIGHFFGNVMERKQVQNDVDQLKNESSQPGSSSELLVSLRETGHRMVENLRNINLKPQHCFRETVIEPINLYHKVGHGKLDMYVLNPAKDSREVREFLSKWHSSDCKSFVQAKMSMKVEQGREVSYPVLNLVSICALLVWQPDNPREPITRILFPGSTPQQKIFEALGKLKHLEFLKYPICSAKTLAASHKSRARSERVISGARHHLSSSVTRMSQHEKSSVGGDHIDNVRSASVHRGPSYSNVPSSKYGIRAKMNLQTARSDSSSTVTADITDKERDILKEEPSKSDIIKERKSRGKERKNNEEPQRIISASSRTERKGLSSEGKLEKDNLETESFSKKREHRVTNRRTDTSMSKSLISANKVTSSSATSLGSGTATPTSAGKLSSRITSRVDSGVRKSIPGSPAKREIEEKPTKKYGIGVNRSARTPSAVAAATTSPPSTPPKSAKDAVNRKVVETKTARRSLIDTHKQKEKAKSTTTPSKTLKSTSSSSIKSKTVPPTTAPTPAPAPTKSTKPSEPKPVKRPGSAVAIGTAAVAAGAAIIAKEVMEEKTDVNEQIKKDSAESTEASKPTSNGFAVHDEMGKKIVEGDGEKEEPFTLIESSDVSTEKQNGGMSSIPVTESSSEMSSLDTASVIEESEDRAQTMSEDIITAISKDQNSPMQVPDLPSESHETVFSGEEEKQETEKDLIQSEELDEEEEEYLVIEKDESTATGGDELDIIDSNIVAEEAEKASKLLAAAISEDRTSEAELPISYPGEEEEDNNEKEVSEEKVDVEKAHTTEDSEQRPMEDISKSEDILQKPDEDIPEKERSRQPEETAETLEINNLEGESTEIIEQSKLVSETSDKKDDEQPLMDIEEADDKPEDDTQLENVPTSDIVEIQKSEVAEETHDVEIIESHTAIETSAVENEPILSDNKKVEDEATKDDSEENLEISATKSTSEQDLTTIDSSQILTGETVEVETSEEEVDKEPLTKEISPSKEILVTNLKVEEADLKVEEADLKVEEEKVTKASSEVSEQIQASTETAELTNEDETVAEEIVEKKSAEETVQELTGPKTDEQKISTESPKQQSPVAFAESEVIVQVTSKTETEEQPKGLSPAPSTDVLTEQEKSPEPPEVASEDITDTQITTEKETVDASENDNVLTSKEVIKSKSQSLEKISEQTETTSVAEPATDQIEDQRSITADEKELQTEAATEDVPEQTQLPNLSTDKQLEPSTHPPRSNETTPEPEIQPTDAQAISFDSQKPDPATESSELLEPESETVEKVESSIEMTKDELGEKVTETKETSSELPIQTVSDKEVDSTSTITATVDEASEVAISSLEKGEESKKNLDSITEVLSVKEMPEELSVQDSVKNTETSDIEAAAESEEKVSDSKPNVTVEEEKPEIDTSTLDKIPESVTETQIEESETESILVSNEDGKDSKVITETSGAIEETKTSEEELLAETIDDTSAQNESPEETIIKSEIQEIQVSVEKEAESKTSELEIASEVINETESSSTDQIPEKDTETVSITPDVIVETSSDKQLSNQSEPTPLETVEEGLEKAESESVPTDQIQDSSPAPSTEMPTVPEISAQSTEESKPSTDLEQLISLEKEPESTEPTEEEIVKDDKPVTESECHAEKVETEDAAKVGEIGTWEAPLPDSTELKTSIQESTSTEAIVKAVEITETSPESKTILESDTPLKPSAETELQVEKVDDTEEVKEQSTETSNQASNDDTVEVQIIHGEKESDASISKEISQELNLQNFSSVDQGKEEAEDQIIEPRSDSKEETDVQDVLDESKTEPPILSEETICTEASRLDDAAADKSSESDKCLETETKPLAKATADEPSVSQEEKVLETAVEHETIKEIFTNESTAPSLTSKVETEDQDSNEKVVEQKPSDEPSPAVLVEADDKLTKASKESSPEPTTQITVHDEADSEIIQSVETDDTQNLQETKISRESSPEPPTQVQSQVQSIPETSASDVTDTKTTTIIETNTDDTEVLVESVEIKSTDHNEKEEKGEEESAASAETVIEAETVLSEETSSKVDPSICEAVTETQEPDIKKSEETLIDILTNKEKSSEPMTQASVSKSPEPEHVPEDKGGIPEEIQVQSEKITLQFLDKGHKADQELITEKSLTTVSEEVSEEKAKDVVTVENIPVEEILEPQILAEPSDKNGLENVVDVSSSEGIQIQEKQITEKVDEEGTEHGESIDKVAETTFSQAESSTQDLPKTDIMVEAIDTGIGSSEEKSLEPMVSEESNKQLEELECLTITPTTEKAEDKISSETSPVLEATDIKNEVLISQEEKQDEEKKAESSQVELSAEKSPVKDLPIKECAELLHVAESSEPNKETVILEEASKDDILTSIEETEELKSTVTYTGTQPQQPESKKHTKLEEILAPSTTESEIIVQQDDLLTSETPLLVTQKESEISDEKSVSSEDKCQDIAPTDSSSVKATHEDQSSVLIEEPPTETTSEAKTDLVDTNKESEMISKSEAIVPEVPLEESKEEELATESSIQKNSDLMQIESTEEKISVSSVTEQKEEPIKMTNEPDVSAPTLIESTDIDDLKSSEKTSENQTTEFADSVVSQEELVESKVPDVEEKTNDAKEGEQSEVTEEISDIKKDEKAVVSQEQAKTETVISTTIESNEFAPDTDAAAVPQRVEESMPDNLELFSLNVETTENVEKTEDPVPDVNVVETASVLEEHSSEKLIEIIETTDDKSVKEAEDTPSLINISAATEQETAITPEVKLIELKDQEQGDSGFSGLDDDAGGYVGPEKAAETDALVELKSPSAEEIISVKEPLVCTSSPLESKDQVADVETDKKITHKKETESLDTSLSVKSIIETVVEKVEVSSSEKQTIETESGDIKLKTDHSSESIQTIVGTSHGSDLGKDANQSDLEKLSAGKDAPDISKTVESKDDVVVTESCTDPTEIMGPGDFEVCSASSAVADVLTRQTRESEMDTDDDEEIERRCSVASVMGDDRVPDDLDDGEDEKQIRQTLIDGEYKDAADIETSRESQFGSESKILDDDQPMTDEPAGGEELVMDKEVMTGSVVQIDTSDKVVAAEVSPLSTPQAELFQGDDKTKVSPTIISEPTPDLKPGFGSQVPTLDTKDKAEKVDSGETEAINKKEASTVDPTESKAAMKEESALPPDETDQTPLDIEGLNKPSGSVSMTPSAPFHETSVKKEERSRPVQIPSAIPSKIPRESREVIRTPDEVADLPVHEEVEPGTYETDEYVGDGNENEDADELDQKENDEILGDQHQEPLGPDEEEFSEEDHGVDAIEIARSPLPGSLPPTSTPPSCINIEDEKSQLPTEDKEIKIEMLPPTEDAPIDKDSNKIEQETQEEKETKPLVEKIEALEPLRQTMTSVVITPSTPPVSVDTTEEAEGHFPIPDAPVTEEEKEPSDERCSVSNVVDATPEDAATKSPEIPDADNKEEEKAEADKDIPPVNVASDEISSVKVADDKEIKTPTQYYEEIAIVEEIAHQAEQKPTVEQILEKARTETVTSTTSSATVVLSEAASKLEEVSHVIDETSGTMTTSIWKEIPSSQADETTQEEEPNSENEKVVELPKDDGEESSIKPEANEGEQERDEEGNGLLGTIQSGLLTAANTASAAVVHQSAKSIMLSSPESGGTPERRESFTLESGTTETEKRIEIEFKTEESKTLPAGQYLEKSPSPISEQEKHELETGEKEKEESKETSEPAPDTKSLETKDADDSTKVAAVDLSQPSLEISESVQSVVQDSKDDALSGHPTDANKSVTVNTTSETMKLSEEDQSDKLVSESIEKHVKLEDNVSVSPELTEEEDIHKKTVDDIASTAEIVVEAADSAVTSAIETASKALEISPTATPEIECTEEEVVEDIIVKTIVEKAISSAETEEKPTLVDVKSATDVILQIQESMSTISHETLKETDENDDKQVEVVEEPCTKAIRPKPHEESNEEDIDKVDKPVAEEKCSKSEIDDEKVVTKEKEETGTESTTAVTCTISDIAESVSSTIIITEETVVAPEQASLPDAEEQIKEATTSQQEAHSEETKTETSVPEKETTLLKKESHSEEIKTDMPVAETETSSLQQESDEIKPESLATEKEISMQVESQEEKVKTESLVSEEEMTSLQSESQEKIKTESSSSVAHTEIISLQQESKSEEIKTESFVEKVETSSLQQESKSEEIKTESFVEKVETSSLQQESHSDEIKTETTVTHEETISVQEESHEEKVKTESSVAEEQITSLQTEVEIKAEPTTLKTFKGIEKVETVFAPAVDPETKPSKPESIKSPVQQLPPDEQHQQSQQQSLPETGRLTSQLELECSEGGDGGGDDGGDGNGNSGVQKTKRKYKQLEDYADKIREAKAVFDTLLNVAKSGVALSSAVDECKKNAQEAIRRSLEAQEDFYRPVKADESTDLPETPEEQGVTIYESLEQMAKAGSILFGELVEKIETKEREAEEAKLKAQLEKEAGTDQGKDEVAPAPQSTDTDDFSAEQAVTIALQHLHETFKTMETLGSPRRSSRHAARRFCHHHPGCQHHETHAHETTTIKDNVSVTSSEGGEQELEGEDDSKSVSSAIFSQSTKSSLSMSLSAASTTTLAESGVKSPDDDVTVSEAETMRESITSFTSGVISDADEREMVIVEKGMTLTESSKGVTETQSGESSNSSLSQEHSQVATSTKISEQETSSTSSTTKVETTSQEQHQSSSSTSTSSTAAIFSEISIIKGESSTSSSEQKTFSAESVEASAAQQSASEDASSTTTTKTKTIFHDSADTKTDPINEGDSKADPPSGGICFRTVTTTTTDISPGGTITKTTITRRVSSTDEEDIKLPLEVGKSPKVPRRASAAGSYSSSKLAAAENKVHAYSYVFGIAAEPDPEEPVDSSISEASEPSFPAPPPLTVTTTLPSIISGSSSHLEHFAESVKSSEHTSMEYSKAGHSAITSDSQTMSTVSSTTVGAAKDEETDQQITRTLILTTQGDDKKHSSLTTTTTTTRIISTASDSEMQQSSSSSITQPTSTTITTVTPAESSSSSSRESQSAKDAITRTTRIETVTTSSSGDEPPTQTTTVIRTRTESGGSRGSREESSQDIPKEWGKPLGLPTIYPTLNAGDSSEGGAEGGSLPGSTGPDSGNFNNGSSLKATPKKSASSEKSKEQSTPAKHSASGTSSSKKSSKKSSKHSPIYVDLAYVPHHGNSHYCDSEFFRMIRGRYYVFSGLEPSREVFEGLLQGKQQWEDKNLDVTIIPTYDTDTLGYWVVDSEDALAEAKIDLAPSASRCTINLQDHETSCAAYRLEF